MQEVHERTPVVVLDPCVGILNARVSKLRDRSVYQNCTVDPDHRVGIRNAHVSELIDTSLYHILILMLTYTPYYVL
jgi:hypothetical protein